MRQVLGICFAAAIGTAIATPAAAAGRARVKGSDVTYAREVTRTIGGQSAALRLTGTALREKAFFNVYAIASYVAADHKPNGATALAGADVPKMLHLVMERDVDGEDMAEAIEDAIKKTHGGKFRSEISKVNRLLSSSEAVEGESLIFVHVPGTGLECVRKGGEKPGSLTVNSVDFARAFWDIYLGPKPVTGDMKRALARSL